MLIFGLVAYCLYLAVLTTKLIFRNSSSMTVSNASVKGLVRLFEWAA